MKDVEHHELQSRNGRWQADAQQISPTLNGRQRALTLMFPASLSRVDNNNWRSGPASPPMTTYIRLINIFTRLEWKRCVFRRLRRSCVSIDCICSGNRGSIHTVLSGDLDRGVTLIGILVTGRRVYTVHSGNLQRGTCWWQSVCIVRENLQRGAILVVSPALRSSISTKSQSGSSRLLLAMH
ncbi:hypothetical protein BDZ45DRAFT_16375 [Acephala macrosclerotiorum]|nr:hypothetical protein BDZ45DRAFT_16375 [Acephala macrosclerotiorum]